MLFCAGTVDRGLEGDGLAFTIGRGNELWVAAIKALERLILGLRLDDLAHSWGFLASADGRHQ
jgi:hypothetical protein